MARFGVGVMHNTINSGFGPKPLVHADYAIGLACRADSQDRCPPRTVDDAGYLAGRNKLGRMRLGVAVTDTGRRNPAVTAQAAASLHLLTRGRAVLGIGTGERESNEPYGVEWSKPVARFEEAVATIRALWDSRGEMVTTCTPWIRRRSRWAGAARARPDSASR
jgi:phthiodiolone/phenolphthiodiolone dimycocerosates ketoreductase